MTGRYYFFSLFLFSWKYNHMKEVKREKVSNFNFLFGHVDDMHARASCPANDTHTQDGLDRYYRLEFFARLLNYYYLGDLGLVFGIFRKFPPFIFEMKKWRGIQIDR
jgi:hypothetical protein